MGILHLKRSGALLNGLVEIFAEADREFFVKAVDAQLTFVTDNAGRTTEVVLHQNGTDRHAKRIGG